MDKELRLLTLHKLFFSLKFHNEESHSEYLELVFSPLYKQLFEEVRNEMVESMQVEDEWINPILKESSEYYERLKSIISAIDSTRLSLEQKELMLEIIIYPFRINPEQRKNLLNFFT